MSEQKSVAILQQDNEVEVLLYRLEKIREIREKVMVEGVHFGQSPGTDTPALWQAGGDILRVAFKLRSIPRVELDPDMIFPHRGYVVHTDIVHLQTGEVWATGVGSCSTMEKKHRWRWLARNCPTCGKPAIRKGSANYGGGFFCNKKEEGCGARYKEDDPKIIEQEVGRMENPDLVDVHNTVLKVAKKRSFIDGILDATGAREQFIPPPEDEEEEELVGVGKQEKRQARQEPKGKVKPEGAYSFQENTMYVGTLRAAHPVSGADPGRLEVDTEHGGLICHFRVTPAAIVNVSNWETLKGKPCSISFLLKEGRSGVKYAVVAEFEIVIDAPEVAA